MEVEKKSFREKWKDKKYQAKVKLSSYGIFILIIIFILLFGQGSNIDNNDINNNINNDINNNIYEENNSLISKPSVNNYTYKIEIITKKDNIQEIINYYGKVNNTYEELIKEVEDEEYNYQIVNSKYYTLNNGNYILTTKEEVYDRLDYVYLDIDNINNYLSYASFVNNRYRVYLSDIILNNNTFDYITITLNDNKVNIDYTSLINSIYDENYDSYIVNISYDI